MEDQVTISLDDDEEEEVNSLPKQYIEIRYPKENTLNLLKKIFSVFKQGYRYSNVEKINYCYKNHSLRR